MASLYPNLDGLMGMAFVPYYNHIMKLLESDPRLKKTAQGICRQVCYAAAGTVLGGVVGGPLGAAVGSVVGTGIGYMKSDNYDSLITVLREMNDDDRRRLVQKVQELVGSGSLEALTEFIGSQVKRELLMGLIRQFVTDTTKENFAVIRQIPWKGLAD